MKVKIFLSILIVALVLGGCSNTNKGDGNSLEKEVSTLTRNVKSLEEENHQLKDSLKELEKKNESLAKTIDRKEKGITYIDTLVEGKETFTTYKNILINFGSPKKIVNIIDEDNIYNHGRFAVLVYDGIEFVVNCSGDSDNPFAIMNTDNVVRVDITREKYKLNRKYFDDITIGSSGLNVAERYNKEINEIDYDDEDDFASNMEIVIKQLRNDFNDYNYGKGIYFSGEMENGLELGVVFLLNDNGSIARIIMGLPSAG
ncbi:hypothetical protein [Sporosalibacterium faouarense]|uniref:hypothetical protein n=1 Tax=Sporosalibacterium faouarense TaxID=516123 RepID=UPI00141CFC60|nr:hypothetical protein [Sporosalibacterium faouarense]MTI49860.1 hypothetical protein [Bacillota bacterium]